LRRPPHGETSGESGDALAGLVISTSEFAALVGLTPAALRLRISAGFIKRAGHGKLNLIDAVHGFLRFEEALAAKAERRANESARARYNTARASEVNARLDRQARDLIMREEAEGALTHVVQIAGEHLRRLADALPPDADRAEVEAHIRATRLKLEKANASLCDALRTGALDEVKL
jgi:hypothetical protein